MIYLHIPKTSGISVADAIVQAVKPSRTWFGFDRAFFGEFADFASIGPENRAFVHDSAATLPPDERVVRAHMSLTTLRQAYPDGQFLTVLREPACRLLSHYLFWRSFNPAALGAWGGWGVRMAIAQGPWADFLTDPLIACQTDNITIRLLLWPHRLIPAGDFIAPRHDRRLLREARQALACFAHIGVMEDPDFWPHLERWLDEPFQVRYKNETPALAPDTRHEIAAGFTPAAAAALSQRTRLDWVLWTEALYRAAPALDSEAAAQAAQWRSIARFAAAA